MSESTSTTLSSIRSIDDYLIKNGKLIGHRARSLLDPLWVPGVNELPSFDEYLREPFEAQAHVIEAIIRMYDNVGSGFLCGEMGTGKTIMGILAADRHAQEKATAGNYPKAYYACVLCPDHLITKWKREIEETIPDVDTMTFQNWKDMGKLMQYRVPMSAKDEIANGAKWMKPERPTWFILGRNQVKFMPDWRGLGKERKSKKDSNAKDAENARLVIKRKVIGHHPKLDEHGNQVWGLDKRGLNVRKMEPDIAEYVACPKCGEFPRDEKGNIRGSGEFSRKQITCSAIVLHEVRGEPKNEALDKMSRDKDGKSVNHSIEPGTRRQFSGRDYVAHRCGEQLWTWTDQPWRWAPADFIHKKCRGLIDYLIIDEVHEHKSDESAQSMAAGKLMANSKHVLAMTGTLIGGYADHMMPLLMRIAPDSMRDDGFEWAKTMDFAQRFGRVDTIVTEAEDGDVEVGSSSKSMRKARVGRKSVRKAVRPGIMPALYGKHLLGCSVYLPLTDLSDELPDCPEFLIPVDMTGEQEIAYKFTEEILVAKARELLRRGSLKLLSTMLHTTMDYPDRPFGWERTYPEKEAVGYLQEPKIYTEENFVGVVDPPELDKETIYPKEQALIDICLKEKEAGNQTWVYCQMTSKRDIQQRLKTLLTKAGLRVQVLYSTTVDSKERENWIAKNGKDCDVIISHPRLVSTGLDFFSKEEGGHNFNVICFYQTGYNLFDLRQAARRAWRIAQPKDCKIYYLFYRSTMQHRAMALMSKKMEAAINLEGEFTVEGLAAMASNDASAEMAMAKAMAEKIDDDDLQRGWSKVSSRTVAKEKKPRRPVKTVDTPEAHHPEDFDDFDPDAVEAEILKENAAKKKRKPKAVSIADMPVPMGLDEIEDLLSSLEDVDIIDDFDIVDDDDDIAGDLAMFTMAQSDLDQPDSDRIGIDKLKELMDALDFEEEE